MSILDVKNLVHTVGDKKLFNDASMSLFGGDKLGLTGLNGAGKSTFINILIGEIIPDSGMVKWNPKNKLGYLDQHARVKNEGITVRSHLTDAFSHLFKVQKKLTDITSQIAENLDSTDLDVLMEEMGELQMQLEIEDFYTLESEIDKTAEGLGLTAFGLDTPLSRLSGGQRAKVMLAKLLLEAPDVLLLDEPTNFLDREHIDWLAKYLQGFKGSFIVVSHDFSFLNRIVNCICDIEFGAIARYNGTYESFVNQKEQRHAQHIKNYESQQKEIAKLEDYVQRNIVRASTSKMAKSRRKALERMDVIEKPQESPNPTFLFSMKPVIGKALMTTENLIVGYTQQLLPEIEFSINVGQRLAITGFNGIGKSTLLKTICGIIPCLGGKISLSDKTIISYYEQDNIFNNFQISPIEEIREIYPLMEQKLIRSSLGRCGLRGDQAMQSLSTLSGGEQAKVKICKLMLSPCNLLVLDEPTNHLDTKAVNRLKVAMEQFEGGILFVSHSKQFVEEVATDILDLEKLFD